jgi:anti-sigma regulatory factor (Ser/Thr protein kinase)
MTRLQCQIESTFPVAVVRFVGTLVAHTAPLLWSAALRYLADQPDVLVFDLDGLAMPEPDALSVFPALAHRASVWPGIALIACTSSAGAQELLSQQAVDKALPICPTRDEAMLLASGSPLPRRLVAELQPAVGAARQARDVATEACVRWGTPALAPRASIVTSELVANGVRHAGTPMTLTVSRTLKYLHIAVRDASTDPPVRRYPDPLSTSGRGLMIVEGTAMSWDFTQMGDGKVVWATLPVGR